MPQFVFAAMPASETQIALGDRICQLHGLDKRPGDGAHDEQASHQSQTHDDAASDGYHHIGFGAAGLTQLQRLNPVAVLQLHIGIQGRVVLLRHGIEPLFDQLLRTLEILGLTSLIHLLVHRKQGISMRVHIGHQALGLLGMNLCQHLVAQLVDAGDQAGHGLVLVLDQILFRGHGSCREAIHAHLGQDAPLLGLRSSRLRLHHRRKNALVDTFGISQAACHQQQHPRQKTDHQCPQLPGHGELKQLHEPTNPDKRTHTHRHVRIVNYGLACA